MFASAQKKYNVIGQVEYLNHVVSDDLIVLMQDRTQFKFFALPSLTYFHGIDNLAST